MKLLKEFLNEKLNISKDSKIKINDIVKGEDETSVTLEPWAEFIHINIDKGIIEYLKASDLDSNFVKRHGGYGESTQTAEGILVCIA